MLHLPVLRWGEPYKSIEVDEVVHFATGEPIAKVSRANGGLIQRDMRKAAAGPRRAARDSDRRTDRAGRQGRRALRQGTLPMGDGTQTPDEFVRTQSATTGLPEHMCRANMKKNEFVLGEMGKILTSLTRGLRFDVLSHAATARNAACRSATRPVPGARAGAAVQLARRAHALAADHPDAGRAGAEARAAGAVDAVSAWPRRSSQAGVPREAISIYPGAADVGAAVLDAAAAA